MLNVLEHSPDAFVVTDNDGEILAANRAFTDLVQLSRSEQIVGQSLDRWLGRAGIDLNVLLANLRQRGTVKLFATNLRNENGASIPVEISAVSVPHGELSGLGFTIRDIGRRLGSESQHEIPRSVEQLSELVGRVPMREIVGETTELIEKLCIEAALQLSKGGKESTCVVDLDLYAGECADFLNVEPKLAIDSLAKSSDAIDEHLLESVMSEHPSGLKLLAADRKSTRVNSSHVKRSRMPSSA